MTQENRARLEGSGAIAQDSGVAAGAGGVAVGGSVLGNIHIGDKIFKDDEPRALGSAPPPPTLFVGRDQALHDLKMRLGILPGQDGDAAAAPVQVVTAVRGWPGVGKTTLAAALAHDEDVATALPDGVLWVALGPGPDVMAGLADWGRALGVDLADYTTPEARSARLTHLLRDQRRLLIVDDVWPDEHGQPTAAQPFCVGGRNCRTLVTTRRADLARALAGRAAAVYRLGVMNDADARELLVKLAGPTADTPARGAVEGSELPHLQIICTRLYDTLAADETTITLAAYERLGRAEGVLGSYLHDVLDRLPGQGGAIARAVLKDLVGSQATSRALSRDALAARVEAQGSELDDLLARLVDARLLWREETAGDIVYELAHEYLVEEIGGWIDPADLAFKRLEELLAREVANWRVHGTLIPRDRLELLYRQRERFRGLDGETWTCILRSALHADLAVEDWARFAGETGDQVILASVDDPAARIRRRAARATGQLGMADAIDPLIAALQDEDHTVREAAHRCLA